MTDTPNGSISAQLAQLAALPPLPMADLWALWDQHFPRRPSHRNRNYVESRLAYRIQELAYGALPTNIRKMLVEAGAKHSKIKSSVGRNAQTLLMPGTTLIRERAAVVCAVRAGSDGRAHPRQDRRQQGQGDVVDILPHLRALRSGRGFLFRC
nr:DUF2924 domain-containing protein [Pseudomonas sp. s4]